VGIVEEIIGCYFCVNARWQVQEFDKPLFGTEAGYTSQQATDYKDRWSVCPVSLPSSSSLSNHTSATVAGCLPYQQPSCNVWTGKLESTWKNDVPGTVLPWWNGSSEWITPPNKLLSEPVSSVDQRRLLKHVKVSLVMYVIYNSVYVLK